MSLLAFLFALVALVLAATAHAKLDELKQAAARRNRQLDELERSLQKLWHKTLMQGGEPTPEPPAAQPPPLPVAPPSLPEPAWNQPSNPISALESPAKAESETPAPSVDFRKEEPVEKPAFVPEPPPIQASKPTPPREPVSELFALEQFMGAKLFAWIGGLALFFGVIFFIKYSFEHDLVPPVVRAACGFALGAGLLVAGLLMRRAETQTTAQTLAATGVLTLYGVAFACRAYYHFPLFDTEFTFALMTLVSVLAFAAAVRMDALAVAVLGLAGGFLTPVLLSTGEDAPGLLFGYVALLDTGLLALAVRKRWSPLPLLGAFATALMQLGWMLRFFDAGGYAGGARLLVPMAIFLGFAVLFLTAFFWVERRGERTREEVSTHLALGALAMIGTAFLAAFAFLGCEPWETQPGLLFGYAALLDIGLLTLAVRKDWSPLPLLGAFGTALLQYGWMKRFFIEGDYAIGSNIVIPMAVFLGFQTLFFAAFAWVNRRGNRPITSRENGLWQSPEMPASMALGALAMVGMALVAGFVFLGCRAQGAEPGWLFGYLFGVCAGAVWLALSDGGLRWVGAVVRGVAFAFLAGWIGRYLEPSLLFHALGAVLVFALVHMALPFVVEGRRSAWQQVSALAPFLLLVEIFGKVGMLSRWNWSEAQPHALHWIFATALVLTLGMLALTRWKKLGGLPMVVLAGVWLLEVTFLGMQPQAQLGWALAFYALFTVFPFLFPRTFAERRWPWAASALAGVLAFPVLYVLVPRVVPAWHPQTGWLGMGLLPALMAGPALGGLAAIYRRVVREGSSPLPPARLSQLAWFGGSALFFITLVLPVQCSREWLTLGWAMEGAALCWLFGRVPHPGLRLTGAALLVTAFVRLTCNPAVLEYHARADAAIWNWYLYAYTLAAACCFAAARFLAPPRDRIGGAAAAWLNARMGDTILGTAGVSLLPAFYGMGVALLFWLLNIEIADFFSEPGRAVLTFEFSGNFARDMSYSIGWALFALGLLVAGMRWRTAGARWLGIGLMGVTLLKLFFHDLSQLGQLHRIGAFMAVAAVALLASFLYQRMMGAGEK